MLSLFINWDISPEIFNLGGISIRYYGLLFAVAFILGYKVEEKMFKSEGLPMAWLDKLWLYVAIATIVGARLGHCIFYDWAYYSQHPLEMILPVRFSPEFKFTGYQGLASHGAAIGIIAGLWYYSRKVSKKSIFWILDRAVIPIALAGFFIVKKKMGFIFGAFLILIFSARFIIEFVKEVQEPWEAGMALNMGQILSIPFILAGIFMLWYSKKLPDEGEKKGKKRKG